MATTLEALPFENQNHPRAPRPIPFDEHWLDIRTSQAHLMVIAPEMAARILEERNTSNRRLKPLSIERMAADLREGRWEVNGQTVVFGWNGVLRDGQNRLSACVAAGVPLATWVIFGINPESFATIDIGTARGGADILEIGGEEHGNILAATLALIWLDENGRIHEVTPTPPKSLYRGILARHEGVKAACDLARGPLRIGKLLNPKLTAFCLYRFGQLDQQAAYRFFADLKDGEGLYQGDPVFALRKRLFAETNSKRTLQRAVTLALVIKAWNYRRMNQQIKLLKWADDEQFPVIL